MRAYKNYKGSLETFWYGGNYTDKKVNRLDGDRLVVTGKKRYTGEVFGKEITRKYAERILPYNFTCFY